MMKDPNVIRQRHVFITPTYIYISKGRFELSNKVIRKYVNEYGTNFLRLNFVTE